METRINVEKITENKGEYEIYVPQINFKGSWKNVLSPGSHILKETRNPTILCKSCGGDGCQPCNNRGFRKGESVDQLPLAEMLLKNKVSELEQAIKLIESYSNL